MFPSLKNTDGHPHRTMSSQFALLQRIHTHTHAKLRMAPFSPYVGTWHHWRDSLTPHCCGAMYVPLRGRFSLLFHVTDTQTQHAATKVVSTPPARRDMEGRGQFNSPAQASRIHTTQQYCCIKVGAIRISKYIQ